MNENREQACASGASGFLIGLGVLNMILGFIAMGSPWMAGTIAVILVGIMLLLSGFFEILHALRSPSEKPSLLMFLGGLLALAGGGLVLARPLYGLAVLALILAFYFALDGITRIVSAFNAHPVPVWGWMLFNGLISLFLGLMIWRGWPLSGLWAVGILVGIRIFMAGLTMILLGLAARGIQSNANG